MTQLEILRERDRLGQRLDDERLEDHIRHWFAGEGDTGDDLCEQVDRELEKERKKEKKISLQKKERN